MHKLKVSVFGNPDLPMDAMPIALLPELRKQFPDIEFIHQDPNEECRPLGDTWYIIDAVKGIDKVRLITEMDIIKVSKRLSMHDYDLGMHLTLLKKIYPQLKLRIIGVPIGNKPADILPDVVEMLSSALRENKDR
ncbi:MAG: hypothetical protein HY422_02250 [Candidatus Komeilibacteria bacterium]|nr:hypothetical protein [Candidatus Komeilibacteria bacterium]